MQRESQGFKGRMTPVAMAVMLAVLGNQAQAQEAARKEGEAGLEVVVVSANKRIEKLENVPMAISVLDESLLKNNNARDIEDIVALSPALTVTYGSNLGGSTLSMRGVGTSSFGSGLEPDVVVVVDGVPLGSQAQAFQNLIELSRVEVLKGPQSTLFGKAAVAGAINIVTKPLAGKVVGTASAMLTDDGEWRLGASYGGRLSDEFGLRISASNNHYDGSMNNLTTGRKVNGTGDRSFMARLNWQPIENLDIDFTPRYNKSMRDCCVFALRSMTNIETAKLRNIAAFPASSVLAGITPGPLNRDVRQDYRTGSDTTTRGAGLTVNYALPNGGTVTSITAFERYLMHEQRDNDYVDVPTLLYYPLANGKPGGINDSFHQHGDGSIETRSQELRYVSPNEGPLRYVAGLWYANNELARHFTRGYTGIAASSPTQFEAFVYNKSQALFGQASWDFLPGYTLAAGLRYTHDTSGFTLGIGPTPPGVFTPTSNFSKLGNSENKATGKLSLQHQFTPELMAYVTTATGYKGLGYDVSSGVRAETVAMMPIKGETAITYEAGLKGNFLNNRLTVNLAGFRSLFHDYQTTVTSNLPGSNVLATRLISVPAVQSKGLELDVSALLARDFVLKGSLAYTRAIFREFPNAECYNVPQPNSASNTPNANCRVKDPNYDGSNVQDLAGAPMINAPKWKLSLDGNYDIRLPEYRFDGFVRVNTRFESEVVTHYTQNPQFFRGAVSVTNLGFGIKDKKGGYKLNFFVNNLFDRHYANTGFTGLGQWYSTVAGKTVLNQTSTWMPARDAWRYVGVRLDAKF